ncbi:MAG: hypothetical protein FOGNACKC_00437 [Anaerolineae bacterium]|nr:hypothetical protein [Anaerolineae bacterium]
MQNRSPRHILAVSVLSVAVLVMYLPDWLAAAPPPAADFRYVTDVDFWQRTGRESQVTAAFPLDLRHNLSDLPLNLGDWQGEDVPETNLEVFILLEPEQFLQRRYTNPQGQFVWLTLIGGRQLRSFHPPDLCYAADGWHTGLASRPVTLAGGGQLPGLWLSAQKDAAGQFAAEEHRAFYFYLFPNPQRDQRDGLVLFRVTSPPYGSDDETLAVHADFLRHIFTATGSQPPPVTACGLNLPPTTHPQQAVSALLQQEGEAVVQQDIAAVMRLWAADGRVIDARHTPANTQDDQVWAGADAIRSRYLHQVFPGAPVAITPGEFELTTAGSDVTVTSTTRINGEVAPAGDRWLLRQVDGCWQIRELVFNLEPADGTP